MDGMQELKKDSRFLLGASNDLGDPRLDNITPINMPAQKQFTTLSEVRRQYRIQQETIKDLSEKKQRVSTFGEDVKAGAELFTQSLQQMPRKTESLMLRLFNGHLYPNMTEEEALAVAEANTNIIRADNEAMRNIMVEEGTADSKVTVPLTSGALQVGTYALATLATAGYGGVALAGVQEAGDISQDWAEDYQNKNKGSLKGYSNVSDSLAAVAHGATAAFIENALGVEKLFAPILSRNIAKRLGSQALKSAAGEGAEEFLQEASNLYFSTLTGHEDRSLGEFLQDAATNAVYGAVLGGTFGSLAYYTNQKRIERSLMKEGYSSSEAAQITHEILDLGQHAVTNELRVRDQLTQAYGEEYEKFVDKIESALDSAGWREKFSDRNIREYANNFATAEGMKAIRMSQQLNVPVQEVLDFSKVVVEGNAIHLETPNINDPKALQEKINSINNELQDLKLEVAKNNKKRKDELKIQKTLLEKRIKTLGVRSEINKVRDNNAKARIDQNLISSKAPEIIPNLKNIRQANSREDFVYVGNSRVPVIYSVMPLSEVQGSHINGEVNPKYKFKELQNRTRGTAADNAILQERAANFKPEEVVSSPNTQYGAPIINHNGEVISGNGRLEVIRKAYELGKGQDYINLLNKLGYDTKGIENPVLVRQTADTLTPEQQLAIAEASNISGTSAFDHARQALNDAKRLNKNVTDAESFAMTLPTTERQAYMREGGGFDILSLQRRFNDAVMAWIIGDTKTFEAIVLSNRLSPRVTGGLSQKCGLIVDFATNNPEVGLKEDLRYALVKSASMTSKAQFIDTIQQMDIEDGNTFAADSLLYGMTFGQNSSQVGKFIESYIQRQQGYINDSKDSFLADSLPKFSKNDLMGQTLRNSPLTEGKWNDDGSTNDANLKALFLNQIPVEFTGDGTTNIETPSLFEQKDLKHADTNSKEFKEWFGDSKVVDENGKPLVVYHGTNTEFNTFRTEKIKRGTGFWFSSDKETSTQYGDVKEFYLSAEKIIDVNKNRNDFIRFAKEVLTDIPSDVSENYIISNALMSTKFKEYLQSKGYDAISLSGSYEVFNPNQIKSVYNQGKFSKQSDNIYYQNYNGLFDRELKTIVIGSDFNLGTLPHEMAHFWLDKMFTIWKRGNATTAFNEDFSRLAEILNIKAEQYNLTRDQQEQFASMTEGYIFDRAAFPEGAKPITQLYFDWVPAQYNNLTDIGFRRADKSIYNPIFDKKAKEYFDDLYSGVAGLGKSPMSITFDNPNRADKDEPLPATQEQMKERKKLLDNDRKEQVRQDLKDQPQGVIEATIETINKPDPIIEESYREAVSKEEERPKNTVEKFKQFVRAGKGTNTREEMDIAAQEFIKNNRERAEEIAFGSPIVEEGYVENDSGIDRAVLIINLMKEYNESSPDYLELYHNLALTRSVSAKTLGLTNDVKQGFYLEGYGQIVKRMEEKAAVIRYGRRKDAVNLWNRDIDKFIQRHINSIIDTEANSKERERALKNVLEMAQAEFGVDDKAVQLLQEDLKRASSGKRNSKVFDAWARRFIKKHIQEIAGGSPNNIDLAKLVELSQIAEKARENIDSNDADLSVSAAIAIRNWQDFVASTGIKAGMLDKLVGQIASRSMLSGIGTHTVNIVSNYVSELTTKTATSAFYGENIIPDSVIDTESERLGRIFNKSGMNLAQIMKIKEVSKIHGEEYMIAPEAKTKLQKLDPMRWLGWEDFQFRRRVYLDTLGKIASKDAKGDVNKAVELFNQYKQLNTTDQTSIDKRMEAILVSNLAVFQEDGTLAKLFTNVRNALDLINLTEFGKSGHKGVGTLLAPFIKTPANIVGMGLEALGSPFKSVYRVGQKILGKDVKIVKDIREAVALSNGVSLTILCGIIAAMSEYEEPYEAPMPYDPNKPYDSIHLGRGFWLGLDTFGPLATPLRIALKMMNRYKSGKDWQNITSGGIGAVVENLPIASDIKDELDFLVNKPDMFLTNSAYNQVNKLWPAFIRNIQAPATRLARGKSESIDIFGNESKMAQKLSRRFARAYGLDGQETNVNEWIKILYNRLKYAPDN